MTIYKTHEGDKIGGIRIGKGAFIGTNVVLSNGVKIAAGAVIGAKALVTRDCLDKAVYVGIPAKKIRNLHDKVIEEKIGRVNDISFTEKIARSKKIIRETLERYKKVRFACSWGKDSMVMLHLALEVDKGIDVFTVLTPYKPKETFEYMDRMKRKWKLNLKEYTSHESVVYELYKTDPDECCRILKVEPTKEAIKGYDAWVTGLRKDEGYTRTNYKEVEIYDDIVKINPILDWSEREIWQYIAVYGIDSHPWYKDGYRSIGCAPCTSIVSDDEPERSGRWRGTSKCSGECGIHSYKKKK